VVKIPYKVPYKIKVKIQYNIRYKSWYKSYYKYKEKWKYTWKYTWKNKVAYKWTYKWTYKWAYKSVTKTSYRYETRYGYDATHTKKLLAAISDITKNYEIAGIHLDYVRYSGVGNNAAYKHPKGTETITNFVKNVYNTVKSIKQKVAVSAALMPEGSVNAYYYGQDYGQLSKYLDFLVPMIYKGNYGQNTAWIGSTTKYIVDHANGKPVVAGIQTYRSDKDLTSLSADELRQDIKAAMDKGAAGYVLFRLGLIDQNFFNSDNSVVPSDPPNDNSNNLTLEQIQIAATTVKNYVESNGRLPEYVQISTKQISMPQFAKILIISVLQIEQGIKTPIKISDIGAAPDPNGDLIDGNINKSEYLDLAQRIRTFMESEGRAPNYAISSLGKIRFEYLVYNYAKIIDFYKSNQRLPNYTIFESWRMNFIPSDLELYLKPTNNCQSDNAAIKALASSITKGLNLTYDKADAIFKWVRDNCSYTFYYNTKYGAVEMSNRLNGNCIDHSHLIVALARATGIPARYGHAQCEFTTMTVGHVWADLYVNGKWYTADATSSRNSLGSMNNCKILYMKGNYIELPF
ncbi:MAG: hypothetical protein FJ150_00435, partial [Euryarchaeota archaeon]|nr:hypothetical protein [Euryarchaeota archaeon]